MATVALSFAACKNSSDNPAPEEITKDSKYGVTIQVEAAGEKHDYILPVEDLMKEGSVSPVGFGIDVTGKIDQTYGVREGSNIFITDGNAVFKYSVATGDIVEKEMR